MIKIIKHGNKSFRVTCRKCHCTFEFERQDVEQDGPIYDPMVSIHCPDCHAILSAYDIDDLVSWYK